MPFMTKGEIGTDVKHVGILLPHEIFARLYSENRGEFIKVFGTEGARIQYWADVGSREAWFNDHPDKDEILRYPQRCCPLTLHGDDVCCKRGLSPLSALVQSLSSPVSWHHFDAVLLVACIVLKWLRDDSLRFLYDVVQWSMNCIVSGRWPDRDHANRSFAGDGTYRERYAGQWLAPVSDD
eukprot:6969306-Pyramimonas_sp.AAC.1